MMPLLSTIQPLLCCAKIVELRAYYLALKALSFQSLDKDIELP